MRYWRIAALCCLGFVAAACGDEESPTAFNEAGNLHGTWVLEEGEEITYVRVTSTAIRVYELQDTCFSRSDYSIEAVDGTMFTVVQDTLQDDWQLSVENDVLVMTNGEGSVELAASDVSVESLNLCAAVVLFGNLHPSCSELPMMPVPGSIEGVLQEGDARWAGSWYDVYSLQLTSSTLMNVSLTSIDDDLDMYLAIFPATGGAGSGDAIVRNDDIDYDGGDYNSELQVQLDPGCYVIVANSYDGDDAGEDGGNYRLEVIADVEPEPEPDFPPALSCTELPQLALDGSVMGTIEEADGHWPSDGSYFDVYGLQIATAGEVTLEHRAGADDAIDPYLFLYNEDGSADIDEDDDGAGDTDSQIVATLDPGCYLVVAGSWSTAPEETGTYMVSASSGTVPPEVAHEACVNLPMVVAGTTIAGTLAAGDSTWDDTWVDLYSLQLTESTDIQLTLQEAGSGIDTWLGIYDFQSGTRIIRNDDIDFDGGNYNSQIVTTLAPGCYVVFANSYSPDEDHPDGGAYELDLTTP